MHQSPCFWSFLVNLFQSKLLSTCLIFPFLSLSRTHKDGISCSLMFAVSAVIMENRLRQRGDFYNSREFSSRRSMKKKPPRCSWQPTVPSWEKAFCKVVGSLDWEVIVDMKKFVHLYDNVVKWNDSAGEEAFHNARKRFLAKMQGLPCDISLPNPDLYIDEVDWDLEVDPELLLDLEREYSLPDASENHETVVIFGDSLYSNEAFSAAGWGENEENFIKATNLSSNNPENPREKVLCINKQTETGNGWGEPSQNTHPLDEGGETVGRETSLYPNQYGYRVFEPKERNGADNDVVQGTWEVNNGKKEEIGAFAPRNNTSRFHGNEQKRSSKWRNGKGQKRESFLYENSTTVNKKLPSRCWKPLSSCSPLSCHGSSEAGQTWNLEKTIL